uniref:Methionine synthase reductase n=1 Tax=Lepisosteus oculatus TaxID=7918 RepID=W5N7W4_LEPOC|nr:PREDICTED: methionine synthase reductase isoform X1 [Lepisosteus oculatus]
MGLNRRGPRFALAVLHNVTQPRRDCRRACEFLEAPGPFGFLAMPCQVKSRFLLLYGSQRGQAKAIAEEIGEQAGERGLVADICCLSQEDKYNLEKETAPVVFVVSTTGDGEPPDTALRFVKGLRAKTLPADHCAHLRYALLALGDSNYPHFCNCGKTIDKRLRELGAQQFYATGHADDGVGLELVVDPWIEGLWEAMRKALSDMSAAPERRGCAPDPGEADRSGLDLKIQFLALNDSAGPSPAVPESDAETAPLEASLHASVPPLSESALGVPALPPPFLSAELLEPLELLGTDGDGPCAEEPVHQVSVTRAEQLTREDAVKTALLLELEIAGTPFSYEPGDSFHVFCPNPTTQVEGLLQRLGLAARRGHRVRLQLLPQTRKRAAQIPSYIPENATLHCLLTWCLEITSVPKKAFLRALVDCTTDAAEQRRLLELCSKQGSADYSRFVRDPGLTLLELLGAFPSCAPPLSLLVEHLPRLHPRPYSAASSSLCHPGKLRFVFNIAEYPACSGRPVPRRGVCTGWLAQLVSPVLRPRGGPRPGPQPGLPGPKVSVSLRPSTAFHLPSDPTVPFIMVGPGTGVAPFIGFLQHRDQQRREIPDGDFGETWLFFGCRHKDRDFLFREELERFVESGTLTHLKVCFSRDAQQGEAPAPKYVQDNLRLHTRDVARVLFKQNGCFYVCGDAKNMARDVNEALIGIAGAELGLEKLEALQAVAALRDEKRYLQDIWG